MSPAQRHNPRATNRHRLKVRRAQVSRTFSKSLGPSLIKVFFFVCSLFFVVLAWQLYGSWKSSRWILGTRITVVIASENPKIYSYNPQTEKLIFFELPGSTQVDATGGYGKWLVKSLWKFGKQEGVDGEILRSSVQKALGMPIDGWTEEGGGVLFANKKLGLVDALFTAATTTGTMSNLTFFDRLHLLLKLGTVGFAGRREIDLLSSGVLKEGKLEDGESGYNVISEEAKIAFEELHDDLIFAEGKKIVVVNASAKSGLAGDITRIVSVLGVRIIGVQTAKDEVKDCEIRGENQELKSLSAQRLAVIFRCEMVENSPAGPQDLELWLGEEFANKF